MIEPIWAELNETLVIHDMQIAEHGGAAGLRDAGLLESALARPKNLFAYAPESATPARLAACYAVGIIANHPFVDGNKRTALVVALGFLELNGVMIDASQEEKYLVFLDVASGELSEDQLARWFDGHSESA
jgi:death on curing protein